MISNETNKNLFDLTVATHGLVQEPMTGTQEITLEVWGTTFDLQIGRHFVRIDVRTAERVRSWFGSTDNHDWKSTLQAWLVLNQGIFNGTMDCPAEIAPFEFKDDPGLDDCPCDEDFENRNRFDGFSRIDHHDNDGVLRLSRNMRDSDGDLIAQ